MRLQRGGGNRTGTAHLLLLVGRMWPTHIHNEIINEAFPGLSKDQLNILQKASHDTDYNNPIHGYSPQDVEVSFVHGMSDGQHSQDQSEARQQGDAFVADNESKAQQVQEFWAQSGHTGVSPNALTAFGNALHTVEDRTSPAHEGEQPWYGSWHWSAVQHVWAEHSINQNQMNNSVAAARYAYFRTFGLNLYLLATGAHGACVTTIDSRTGTATTTCE
jgi:hypothetical protein